MKNSVMFSIDKLRIMAKFTHEIFIYVSLTRTLKATIITHQ